MTPTLLLLALAASASPPERCGLDPEPVPGFMLEDANTSSATFGQTYTLTQLQGTVSVVYFAGAT